MENDWPYALFVLVDLDHKIIDRILHAPGYPTVFWLASDTYGDAPAKKPPGSKHGNEGTKPPISDELRSPWIGSRVESLARWLQAKPEECDLNDRHFAVLDDGAREDYATVVCCRYGDHEGKGDKLYLIRKGRKEAVDHLFAAPPSRWEEIVDEAGLGAEIRYGDGNA